MIIPPSLNPGDEVALVATARKISEEELRPAVELLRSWDLAPVFAPGLFDAHNQFAGRDDHRMHSLQWALDDEDIKAVWCVRGGYGTVRIIDRLNLDLLESRPKWIIGYSDITVLHSHISRHLGMCTLHATMPVNLPTNSPEALSSLHSILLGGRPSYSLPGHELNRTGEARGRLTGGNLSVLYSLLGSSSDISTEGCVLLLEDLDEYLYHIDRMMVALDRAGKLDGLSALLVGGMSDMKDNAVPFGLTAEEIIRQVVDKYNYPVLFNVPSGHISDNRALVMGAEVSLANGIISFL